MDASPHLAARAVTRGHRPRAAAVAAAVVVAAFAAAASATATVLGASAPATFNSLDSLDRQAPDDPAGAGPPGSRGPTSFCNGPVSITATCPCYWRVQAESLVSGLSLDAALVLAETQPPETTEEDLEAAAVTLASLSVSGGVLAPVQDTEGVFLFRSRASIIRHPVTVVATATLQGGTGVGDNGDCETILFMPFRPVEATCAVRDISIGGSGSRVATARGPAAVTEEPPAALAADLTEADVDDHREPRWMRDDKFESAQVSRVFGRIVGGTPLTDPEARRWVVKIYANRDDRLRLSCTGSAIGLRHVLTAAHCEITVGSVVGFLSSSRSGAGTNVSVVAVTGHPDYDEGTNENDVAVLGLADDAPGWPAADAEEPPPVVINRDAVVPADNSAARASGYGVITEGYGFGVGVARSVDTLVVPPDLCEDIYGGIETPNGPASEGHAPALMICAGIPSGGCDSCQGDSGGPLYQTTTVTTGGVTSTVSVIIGVTSWGVGCARPRVPGVYARMSAYAEWLDGVIGAPTSMRAAVA